MSIQPSAFAKLFRRFSSQLVLAVVFSLAGPVIAIGAPLEIIQPRAGLDINNRFYRAYPGLLYEVQIAAIGGTYPNSYQLVSGPNGLTVDGATGVISWPNPPASQTPVSVSVRVIDESGAQATVTWPVTVTTTGFRFVDAVNGKTAANGGNGTLASPWKSMADWYINKYDSTYRNVFLYFRAGTYRTLDAPLEDGWRLALPGNKPVVWLAYPGEKPVIDVTGSHVSAYPDISDLYMDGLEFRNWTTNFAFALESGGSNNTFRKNIFRRLPAGAGGGGTNASGIFLSRGETVSNYVAIVDNKFLEVHGQGYGILGYNGSKVLVQGNEFSDFTVSDSKAIGPKMNNSLWFIRDNRIDIAYGQGVWIDTYAYTSQIEVSYNFVRSLNDYPFWVGQEDADYGAIVSYRNTYLGDPIAVSNLRNGRGPVSFTNDVIINSSTAANGITTPDSSVTSQSLQTSGLLTGSPAKGIVDSNGNLTSAYSQYIGHKGYQRSASSEAPHPQLQPEPPGNVFVQ